MNAPALRILQGSDGALGVNPVQPPGITPMALMDACYDQAGVTTIYQPAWIPAKNMPI
jgi:hypothetical protein